jgi:hypothetical protein
MKRMMKVIAGFLLPALGFAAALSLASSGCSSDSTAPVSSSEDEVSAGQRLVFAASQATHAATGIAYYEYQGSGMSALADDGRVLASVRTVGANGHYRTSLVVGNERLDLAYTAQKDDSGAIVDGTANGRALRIHVSSNGNLLQADGLPTMSANLSNMFRATLTDLQAFGSAHDAGHFAHCALAAVETGVSIAFGHPIGLLFGVAGMALCALT